MAKIKQFDLYLYLTRRDSTGVRIIAHLTGSYLSPVRLDEAGLLGLQLHPTWYNEINQIVYANRMLWEPWIQSVESFEQFKISLKKRGYTNIPISNQPEFTVSTSQSKTVNVSYLPANKTMIRKA